MSAIHHSVHFRGTCAAACIALAALAAACADSTAPAPTGTASNPSAPSTSHAGFDIGVYPGDATMHAWANGASPYEWVGYYLPAPCHRDSTWSGTRVRVAALGWGFAVIYVGQQTWDGVAARLAPSGDVLAPSATRITEGAAAAGPTCTRTLLSAAEGDAEAADAIATTASEGFADGTVIFLDLEPMDSVSAAMQSYYRAWVGRVLSDGRFRSGIYAHRKNAAQIYADTHDVYMRNGQSGAPEFWITGGVGFSLASHPADTGFEFASMWQGAYDVLRTYGGASARIDENVSRNASPSSPTVLSSP